MPARVQRTIGHILECRMQSFVRCSTCRKYRQIDLPTLIAKVGPDYSLWNRRCRCRLTKGCKGWNRFLVGPGWHTPDYDEATEWRWFEMEWEERHRGG